MDIWLVGSCILSFAIGIVIGLIVMSVALVKRCQQCGGELYNDPKDGCTKDSCSY